MLVGTKEVLSGVCKTPWYVATMQGKKWANDMGKHFYQNRTGGTECFPRKVSKNKGRKTQRWKNQLGKETIKAFREASRGLKGHAEHHWCVDEDILARTFQTPDLKSNHH